MKFVTRNPVSVFAVKDLEDHDAISACLVSITIPIVCPVTVLRPEVFKIFVTTSENVLASQTLLANNAHLARPDTINTRNVCHATVTLMDLEDFLVTTKDNAYASTISTEKLVVSAKNLSTISQLAKIVTVIQLE